MNNLGDEIFIVILLDILTMLFWGFVLLFPIAFLIECIASMINYN